MSFAKLEKSGSQPTFKSRNTLWLKGDIYSVDVICIVVIRKVFICSQMSMFLITQKPADITETVQSRCCWRRLPEKDQLLTVFRNTFGMDL